MAAVTLIRFLRYTKQLLRQLQLRFIHFESPLVDLTGDGQPVREVEVHQVHVRVLAFGIETTYSLVSA